MKCFFCMFTSSVILNHSNRFVYGIRFNTISKVRTNARYNVQNEGPVRGLIFVYLLMLIIHITKHASTQECARDDERGLP